MAFEPLEREDSPRALVLEDRLADDVVPLRTFDELTDLRAIEEFVPFERALELLLRPLDPAEMLRAFVSGEVRFAPELDDDPPLLLDAAELESVRAPFFPPPSCLFTVAQARFSAAFAERPRSS